MKTLDTIIPNRDKAIFLAKRELPVLVCDAVNLEGINFTLPEVKTLLDGITVGGHKLTEQQIVNNQAEAWRYLFTLVEHGKFDLTATTACELHAIAGNQEALEWGKFRTGNVTIAGSEYLPPPPQQLMTCWDAMVAASDNKNNIIDRAIFIFLTMARMQFFYDVNKRMGRFMMNGLLLAAGYPAINLPAKRQLEFNELMLDFYPSGDETAMTDFMKSCVDNNIIAIMAEK